MRTARVVGLFGILVTAIGSGEGWGRLPDEDAIVKQVKGILSAQAEAWNRGDIDGFMAHYWKSEQLTFSSGGKTTRGWSETVANYKRRYPTRESMGTVAFSELEITPLGRVAALVLGRWELERASGPVGGNFTVVFRRIGGQWVIIHDHTSRRPQGDG